MLRDFGIGLQGTTTSPQASRKYFVLTYFNVKMISCFPKLFILFGVWETLGPIQ